jgi:hypothetical protein
MIPRHQVAVRPNPRLRPLLPWYPGFLIFFVTWPFSLTSWQLACIPCEPRQSSGRQALNQRNIVALEKDLLRPVSIHPAYDLVPGDAYPQIPPGLFGVRLGDLLDLDGVVDLAVC